MKIGNFGITELLIILAIVVLLFGVGRLGKIGAELGKGIRSFRQAVRDGAEEEGEEAPATEEQEE
jgi:sec-independent protein translocase protein TatA